MDIYPAIDLKGGRCVRLAQGDFERVTTYSEDPVVIAEQWHAAGARWLHIVDLDAAKTGAANPDNRNVVREIVRRVGLPIQFGGGVRTLEAVQELLEIGVERTVIGTAATGNPAFAESLFAKYGDRVAVGVDARDGLVAVHGWQASSGELATDLVARMAAIGASRFIYTDIARDGMLQGINFASLTQVALAAPGVAITASGGVATIDDIDLLIQLQLDSCPNVDAVIIGKALYAGTVTLEQVLERANAAATLCG